MAFSSDYFDDARFGGPAATTELNCYLRQRSWRNSCGSKVEMRFMEHAPRREVQRHVGVSSGVQSATRVSPPTCTDEPQATYFLVVVTVFKNEADILREWLEHHVWQGVEHFFMIDNGSTDDWRTAAAPYADLMTVETNGTAHAQTELLNFFWPHIRRRARWLLSIDVDEFVYTRPGSTFDGIPAYLRHVEHKDCATACVMLHWIMFGSSGHMRQPPAVRRYFVRSANNSERQTKYIVRTSAVAELHVHRPIGITALPLQQRALVEQSLALNHYAILSRERFGSVKMTRGDVAAAKYEGMRTWSYFDQYDRASNAINNTELAELSRSSHTLPGRTLVGISYACANKLSTRRLFAQLERMCARYDALQVVLNSYDTVGHACKSHIPLPSCATPLAVPYGLAFFWKHGLGAHIVRGYEYIWLPDSDVDFDSFRLDSALAVLDSAPGILLAQPCIDAPPGRLSTYHIPLRCEADANVLEAAAPLGCRADEVNNVEVMAPLFRQSAWSVVHDRLLSQLGDGFLNASTSKIDLVWCNMLADYAAEGASSKDAQGGVCAVLPSVRLKHLDHRTLNANAGRPAPRGLDPQSRWPRYYNDINTQAGTTRRLRCMAPLPTQQLCGGKLVSRPMVKGRPSVHCGARYPCVQLTHIPKAAGMSLFTELQALGFAFSTSRCVGAG